MSNSQHLSLTNEHYTPLEITQLYSQLIEGQIDLDPFSCEVANSLVNARNYYSKENEENGFLLPWCGSVFCNPPGSFIRLPDYLPSKRGASSMAVAFDKAEAEYLSGNVEQILFVAFSLELLTKRPSIANYPRCFVNTTGHENYPHLVTGGGRLKYLDSNLELQKSPTHGSFLIYFPCRGQEKLYSQGFDELFSSFGSVVLP